MVMLKEILAIGNYQSLQSNRPFRDKLVLLLKLYGLVFLFNFLTAPLNFLWEYLVTHVWHHRSLLAQYQAGMQNFFHKLGYLQAVVYISIIGPVIEETVFRLPLTFKRQHTAIAIACVFMLLARLLPGTAHLSLGYLLVLRVVMFALGYLILIRLLPRNISPGKKTRTAVIIASALVFGLMHISNYLPLQWGIFFIYPLYVLPQLIMGWALTYIRFKNGIFWSIALHCLINSVSVLIMVIAGNPYK